MKKLFFILLLAIVLELKQEANAQIISNGSMANHVLAACGTDTIQGWGNNGSGQLGNGAPTVNLCYCDSVPVHTIISGGITAIATGSSHTLILKSDSTLWSWGYNGYGQVGDGTLTDSYTPTQLNSLSGIIGISAGSQYSLAVKSDGTVWAWGENYYGQLGVGDTTNRNAPVQVSGLTGMVAVSGGWGTSLALKNDGTVWGWGRGDYGAIGDGTYTQHLLPVQCNALTGMIAVASGGFRSVALKNNGAVWVWGSGPLGDGSGGNPTPVPAAITGVTAIATGYTHSLALKSDSTVWAWGINPYGEFGNGTTTNSSLPIQSTPISGVTAIGIGYGFSIARKYDGTIWSWGRNPEGQLGDGTRIERHNPVQALNFCELITSAQNIPSSFIEELLITPTLTTGEFTITFPHGMSEASISIYNLPGEKVYTETISGTQKEINIKTLPAGIYFVKVFDGEKYHCKKIIIEHD